MSQLEKWLNFEGPDVTILKANSTNTYQIVNIWLKYLWVSRWSVCHNWLVSTYSVSGQWFVFEWPVLVIEQSVGGQWWVVSNGGWVAVTQWLIVSTNWVAMKWWVFECTDLWNLYKSWKVLQVLQGLTVDIKFLHFLLTPESLSVGKSSSTSTVCPKLAYYV